jgi:hypothetical protein
MMYGITKLALKISFTTAFCVVIAIESAVAQSVTWPVPLLSTDGSVPKEQALKKVLIDPTTNDVVVLFPPSEE